VTTDEFPPGFVWSESEGRPVYVGGPPTGWTEFICAHGHRWQAEDKSKHCPVCGTSTFNKTPASTTTSAERSSPKVQS
jgi:hypothetical protein